MKLTLELASFCTGLRYADIPPQALAVVRTGFTDCVATLVAGRHDAAVRILRQVIDPPPGPCKLLFGLGTARAADAALINGTAAHALDFDDTAMRGHPSVGIVNAVLAEAEELRCDGQAMATAYAAGYETWAELVGREVDSHALHAGSWHPTGVFGAVAAAAACASLRRLSSEQAAHALGIAASHSSGLIASFGSFTKPLHAGRAAQAGVLAARLAQCGFTASPEALEHPKGLLHGISPNGKIDLDSPLRAGRQWSLPVHRLGIKKYPACYATHRSIDGMLDLIAEHGMEPAQVKSVTVTISARDQSTSRYAMPQTGMQAKFSMQFAMAAALIARRCGLMEYEDAFVQRPDVQALMAHVSVQACTVAVPGRPGHAQHDVVQVDLHDGRRLEHAVEFVRGGAELPLLAGELYAKFESCMAFGGLDAPAKPLFDALMAVDQLTGTSQLYALAGLDGHAPAPSHRKESVLT